MRNPLQRYYGRGDLHFITFSCYRRRPLLGASHARDYFLKVLDEVRARHKFLLLGYVLMPEHVHLLLSEPTLSDPSKVLQVLKQKVSRALRDTASKLILRQPSVRFAEGVDEEGAFWQRRFYDFNVWSEKKVNEKLEYMHANPVKRELVTHPKDWPWSSWSHYAKGEQGLIRIDSICEKPGSDRVGQPKGKKSQKPHP